MNTLRILVLLVVFVLSCPMDAFAADREVVVYTALDRGFSEPVLKRFEADTGIKVLAVYDTESTKTIGLVNRIRAEKRRPRCDVFWNNEIVNTIRLKRDGLLQPCQPTEAQHYDKQFQDADGYWYGFAARARVLLVNTELVAGAETPGSLFDLTNPTWKNKVGLAKPLFGTTASHVACLYAQLGVERAEGWLGQMKANGVRIMSGNKSCAEAVGKGVLHCGLTDTDDAMIEVEAGSPVRIVYLDSKPEQIGTLFIPNTLSVVKGAPHPEEALVLIEYLLSLKVETMLAEGRSAQIPLRKDFEGTVRVQTPQQVKAAEVDFEAAAQAFDPAAKFIAQHFLD